MGHEKQHAHKVAKRRVEKAIEKANKQSRKDTQKAQLQEAQERGAKSRKREKEMKTGFKVPTKPTGPVQLNDFAHRAMANLVRKNKKKKGAAAVAATRPHGKNKKKSAPVTNPAVL